MSVTSQGSGLVDHAGWGGIQGLPLRASRIAARGWWPWLRAVVRQERMRQWRWRVARVRQQPPAAGHPRRRDRGRDPPAPAGAAHHAVLGHRQRGRRHVMHLHRGRDPPRSPRQFRPASAAGTRLDGHDLIRPRRPGQARAPRRSAAASARSDPTSAACSATTASSSATRAASSAFESASSSYDGCPKGGIPEPNHDHKVDASADTPQIKEKPDWLQMSGPRLSVRSAMVMAVALRSWWSCNGTARRAYEGRPGPGHPG